MSLRLELWDPPGIAAPVKKIETIKVMESSGKRPLRGVGNGRMIIEEEFDDLALISNAVPGDPAEDVASMVRVWDDDEHIQDWLIEPAPVNLEEEGAMSLEGRDVKYSLAWAYAEAWDWDGTAEFTTTIPNWVYGGRNLLTNPGFERESYEPTTYQLVIDATAGTFTLSDGTDTTSPLAYNISDGLLEFGLESGITAIDDLNAAPLGETPVGYQLLITATGGDFTMSDGSGTTAALAAGISAAALETAIEGLPTISNVVVNAVTIDGDDGFQIDLVTPASADLSIDTSNLTDGSASLTVSNTGDGFELTFVNPAIGISLTANDAGLTGSASLNLVQGGRITPEGWTISQQISVGSPRDFGVYDGFEVVRAPHPVHSGTQSLRIDPAVVESRLLAFAGVQQRRNVQPGGLLQPGIWVYPTAAGQTYALAIRGLDEDRIARREVSPPANTWTQVAIPDVVADRSEVIFRFANTNLSGDPAPFYVDDATFNEGMQVANAGKILVDQWDTPVRGVVARGELAHIALDFDEINTSSGAPWDEEFSFTVRMGETMLNVVGRLEAEGYEFDLVPDVYDDATYLLKGWNPGTRGDGEEPDPADPSPSILLGLGTATAQTTRRHSAWNAVMVQGAEGNTIRVNSAASEAAMGRRARFIHDDAGPLSIIADAALDDGLNQGLINGVTINAGLDHPVPWRDFDLGWDIDWDLADGNGKQSQRIGAISYHETRADGLAYTVFPDKETFSGEGAMAEGLRRLLERETFPEVDDEPPATQFGGRGGAPSVFVASSEASDRENAIAHFHCTGVDDHKVIQAAIDSLSKDFLSTGAGRVLLSSGRFYCKLRDFPDYILVQQNVWIQGMGIDSTAINYENSSASDGAFGLVFGGGAAGGKISDLAFYTPNDGGNSAQQILRISLSSTVVENVLITEATSPFNGTGLWSNTGNLLIDGCTITDCATSIFLNSTTADVRVVDSHIESPSGTCIHTEGTNLIVRGNRLLTTSGVAINGSGSDHLMIQGNHITTGGIVLTSCLAPQVTANTIRSVREHGIEIAGGSDGLIDNNKIYEPGQSAANTWDGIHLSGTSSRHKVTGNQIRSGATTARYGINVTEAAVNCAMVVGNDPGPLADYGTDAINDAGTDTQLAWPNDPVYGDNFVDCPPGS